MSGKTSLYRYFGHSNELLYVGISDNPFRRLGQHGVTKDITMVRYIELEWFDSRAEAGLAEKTAVHRERPHWNIAMQVAKRVPRKTNLPTVHQKPAKGSFSAGPAAGLSGVKPRQMIGPPEPFYIWGVPGVSWEKVHHIIPVDGSADALLPVLLRHGDVLLKPKGYHLPALMQRHVDQGVYVLDEGQSQALAHIERIRATRLARKYTGNAKRTPPRGWDGIMVDADGKPVHMEGEG